MRVRQSMFSNIFSEQIPPKIKLNTLYVLSRGDMRVRVKFDSLHQMNRLVRLGRLQRPFKRFYSAELDPANKSDYAAYVEHWTQHFKTVEEDFELERGLNHIFAADWVPSVDVISEALKASRRLNTFPTAVRILEALEQKAAKPDVYAQYAAQLDALLKELGVPHRKELGDFAIYRDRDPWKE